jgi:hypothetical protein
LADELFRGYDAEESARAGRAGAGARGSREFRGLVIRNDKAGDLPDLARVRGVVASEVLRAAAVASQALREAGVPHALAGGLAVGAHGYPRATEDVNFLVGEEAFLKHAGGLATLRVPIIAVGDVRVDYVPIDEPKGEGDQLRQAVESPPVSEQVPIVPLTALVYMKLKAGRLKDITDLVELLKRGRVEPDVLDRYLAEHAPGLVRRWERAKALAAQEG